MLLTLTHKWVGQAPPKKVKMTPKMILHCQELGNDAKHISEVGFSMGYTVSKNLLKLSHSPADSLRRQ